MFNGFSNIPNPTLNGLQTINSDSIHADIITTDLILLNNINVEPRLNQVLINQSNIEINNQNIEINNQNILNNNNKIISLESKTTNLSYDISNNYTIISGNTILNNLTLSGIIVLPRLNQVLINQNNISINENNIVFNMNNIIALQQKTTGLSYNNNITVVTGALTINGTTIHNGVTTFNNPIITNSSINATSITTSSASIFNGTTSFNGTASYNAVCTFNSAIITNSSITATSITTSSASTFNNNVDIAGNLILNTLNVSTELNKIPTLQQLTTGMSYNGTNNTTTLLNNLSIKKLDTTGELIIRDPNSSNSMSVYYDPTAAGFRFINNTANGYMYFSTKDSNNNIKSFQFNTSQVYCNLLFYIENWIAINYNSRFVLGDANNQGAYFGASIQYIPNNSVTSGLVFYNKGITNNEGWYTNFTHNNLSNNETPTFRMNYANIWSKVNHTMEADLIINGNLDLSTVGKTITFPDNTVQSTAYTTADDTKLNAIGSIYTATLTPTFILTTNTLYNIGSIILPAGSYMFSINVEIATLTGTTSIAQCIAGYSLNSDSMSQGRNLALFHGNGASLFPVGSRISLNTSGFIANGSDDTTYYLLIRCLFGTASRLRFMNDNLYSQFRFTKLS